jgi:hypothetical protein
MPSGPLRSLALVLVALAACATPPVVWPAIAAHEPQDPEPGGPAYLQQYKESYYRALGTGFTATLARERLLADIDGARVLFLGDHHADRQHHERLIDLLEDVRRRDRPLVFALEAIGVEDELAVNAFLEKRLPMHGLRTRLAARVPASWLDSQEVDGAFYRYLLLAAREWHVPAFGLEPIPRLPLAERDAVIATRVRHLALAHPAALVVVVVGHAHLLGHGGLLARVSLPNVAVGARLSVALQRQLAAVRPPPGSLLRTPSGVLFFAPHGDPVTGEGSR